MKKTYQMLALLLCVGLLGISAGCGPSAQKGSASQAGFQEKIRLFEADMRAQAQDLETRLEMLQGRGLQLSDHAKDKWLEGSEVFGEKQEAFRTRLNAARSQSRENWIAYREDLNRRWGEVEAAFQELKKAAGKRE